MLDGSASFRWKTRRRVVRVSDRHPLPLGLLHSRLLWLLLESSIDVPSFHSASATLVHSSASSTFQFGTVLRFVLVIRSSSEHWCHHPLRRNSTTPGLGGLRCRAPHRLAEWQSKRCRDVAVSRCRCVAGAGGRPSVATVGSRPERRQDNEA